jgi:hypothetical protein
MKRTPLYKRIHTAFKKYRKDLRDTWESFYLINSYMLPVHDRVKAGKEATLRLKLVFGPDTKEYSKEDTYGALASLLLKRNPRRTLIDAMSSTENYLSDLAAMVYREYPGRLGGQSVVQTDSPAQFEKMLSLILSSADKGEMIERLVEERVREIFYGNPADFFLKDKAKLGFGDFFKDAKIKPLLDSFVEATSRRNIVVHNAGRVDRKYMREVKNTQFRLGQAVSIPGDYLRATIANLECLAAAATNLVITQVCQESAKGKLGDSLKKFNARIS